ncbi:MAG: DUF1566 domain-containing protein [Pseudomonadota bacterium]
MGLFQKLDFQSDNLPDIDWDLHPAETFAIFESWGGKERIKHASERYYYFFIDTWENPPTLCLMERGIKHARVLARINAPQELIDTAVKKQGKTFGLDKSYAIDDILKKWLKENVVDTTNDGMVFPCETIIEQKAPGSGLPSVDSRLPDDMKSADLPKTPELIGEDDVPAIIRQGNFFDSQHNPSGEFTNFLVDNGDGLTVTDKTTGIMWQRGGCDINSIRKIQAYIRQLNDEKFAGYDDWRLPTMTEALSLLEPQKNSNGQHLNPCFSEAQPFVFIDGKREPGGYWFCDFKQGTIFWASGTIPGGFGRLCRTV